MAPTARPPALPMPRAAMPAFWEMLLAPDVLCPWMRAAALTTHSGAAR